MKIVFMGTPEFAVASLDALCKKGYDVVGVITVPDKPAGRGYELQESAVKKYANEKGLTLLQPDKLKSEDFLEKYKALKPDLNVVVAFRMLPEVVWAFPKHGTFNLHASLLPQYRGAAPINWAIINGEKETGITTFFIDKEIDTGKIILNDKVTITPEMNAGELHNVLMKKGGELVLKTVETIENNEVSLIDQSQLVENQNIILKDAPKLFKENCYLNINSTLAGIYNRIRGLGPDLTAIARFTDLNNQQVPVKIYGSHIEYFTNTANAGDVATDGKTFIAIEHSEGRVFIDELQIPGKKKLASADYLRGSQLSTGGWKLKAL